MNLNYQGKKEEDVCCKKHEEKHEENCCKKEKHEEKGTKVILKCGNPGSVSVPVRNAGTDPLPTFTVTTVSVDTSKFCDPCIKFEVTSNINITTTGGSIALNFQIFKICRNQFAPIPVGPIFTFSRVGTVVESNAFSFFVCDCNTCPDDCCTYSVVVTATTLSTGLVSSITNATISALVVEDTHSCK